MRESKDTVYITGSYLENLEAAPRQYRAIITQVLSLHPTFWEGCSAIRSDYNRVLRAINSPAPEEAFLDIMHMIHKRQDRKKRLHQNRVAREKLSLIHI